MIKNVLKYLGLGLAVVILVLLAAEGVLYAKYRFSDEYKTKKELEKLVEEYKNDPYGGDTPEETLRLFISALKEGDVELASKYFVFDEQGENLDYLNSVKNNNLLSEMISDIEKTELTQDEGRAFFSLTDENNVVISELLIKKNLTTGKWKIEEL